MAQTKTPREHIENFVRVSLESCMESMDFQGPTEEEVEKIMEMLDLHPFLTMFGDKEIVFREYPDSTRYAERFINDIEGVHLGREEVKTIVVLEASALLGRWSKELSTALKGSSNFQEKV